MIAGLTIAFMGVLVLVGASSIQNRLSPAPSGNAVLAKSPVATVTCLGKLEPAGEVIKLGAPSSSQESLISELRCEEGDNIRKGQILAVLDSQKRLKATLQQCQGQLSVAKARLAVTKAGAKKGEISSQSFQIKRIEAELAAKLRSQHAVIARLERTYQQTVIDFGRYDLLYKDHAVSSFDYDQKKLAMETALQNLNEANAMLQQIETTEEAEIQSARATLDRIAEVRSVDVDAAQAEVAQAEGSLAQSCAALEQAYIRSPLDGKILKIFTRPGEKVSEEGFADIGRTQSMFAVAEIYQSDINKIHLGQSVSVTADALPGCYLTGTIKRIGQEVRRQNVINSDPSSNIDERVIEVRVQLDGKSSAQVQHLSNSQITAVIRL
ncbi:MAG: efflux RND transporter periplasmic adaptor subunit [Candidatus Obscuribacterales bacterium]|nr:efflux RND transporter periplasmic adaptor subunit [Candidatus Obscuribacterales bacterium]